MATQSTTVWAYWIARLKTTGRGIEGEAAGHLKTIVVAVLVALVLPHALQFVPGLSGQSNLSAVDKLRTDLWENVLITVATILILVAGGIVYAALAAPYRLWRAAILELNAGAIPKQEATDLLSQMTKAAIEALPDGTTIKVRASRVVGETKETFVLTAEPPPLTGEGNKAIPELGQAQGAVPQTPSETPESPSEFP